MGSREEKPSTVGPIGRASLNHYMTTSRHHDAWNSVPVRHNDVRASFHTWTAIEQKVYYKLSFPALTSVCVVTWKRRSRMFNLRNTPKLYGQMSKATFDCSCDISLR